MTEAPTTDLAAAVAGRFHDLLALASAIDHRHGPDLAADLALRLLDDTDTTSARVNALRAIVAGRSRSRDPRAHFGTMARYLLRDAARTQRRYDERSRPIGLTSQQVEAIEAAYEADAPYKRADRDPNRAVIVGNDAYSAAIDGPHRSTPVDQVAADRAARSSWRRYAVRERTTDRSIEQLREQSLQTMLSRAMRYARIGHESADVTERIRTAAYWRAWYSVDLPAPSGRAQVEVIEACRMACLDLRSLVVTYTDVTEDRSRRARSKSERDAARSEREQREREHEDLRRRTGHQIGTADAPADRQRARSVIGITDLLRRIGIEPTSTNYSAVQRIIRSHAVTVYAVVSRDYGAGSLGDYRERGADVEGPATMPDHRPVKRYRRTDLPMVDRDAIDLRGPRPVYGPLYVRPVESTDRDAITYRRTVARQAATAAVRWAMTVPANVPADHPAIVGAIGEFGRLAE